MMQRMKSSRFVISFLFGAAVAGVSLAPQKSEASPSKRGVQSDALSATVGPPSIRGPKVVIANRGSGTVSVISVNEDEVAATFAMPDGGEPMYVYYSSLANRVFVGDRTNNRAVAFDAERFEIEGFAPAGKGVFHMWGNESTGQLWINNDEDNTTSVVNMQTLQTIGTAQTPADLVALGGKPHDVIVDTAGEFAYVTVVGVKGADYVVKYDTTTLMEVDRAAVGDDPHVSLTPETTLLYVPCQGANSVYVLDKATLDEVDVLAIPGAHGAGMANDGAVFYTTNISGGGTDAIYAIDTMTLLNAGMAVNSPYNTPHNIVLTPDDNKLYLTHSGMNDKVSIYDTSAVDRVPMFVGEVTVGMNPFGLDFVP